MSALVAYESSSEDDEPVKPTADSEAAPVEKPSTAAHTVDGQNGQAPIQTAQQDSPREHQVQVVDGPMVGPTMPDRVVENGLDGETTPATQQSTSERDAVRFLTQASHPMTSIPSSPPGSPDSALNAKFARFLELKAKGVHFNEDLASKSTFRNPSFLSTMVARVGLDESDQYRTSLPPQIWNPLAFPSWAYKEELLRSQQTIREQESATKKSLSAAGKRTIEFTSGGTPGVSSRDSTPGMSSKRKRH
ncbi:hypothetical protein HRR82_008416 [Exophiala dermatitidis]|nr:hypothetical protein HRR82_008416 [Exophiala dermatitidis]